MRFLKDPRYWGGVVTGVVLYVLWHNYGRGKFGQ